MTSQESGKEFEGVSFYNTPKKQNGKRGYARTIRYTGSREKQRVTLCVAMAVVFRKCHLIQSRWFC